MKTYKLRDGLWNVIEVMAKSYDDAFEAAMKKGFMAVRVLTITK